MDVCERGQCGGVALLTRALLSREPPTVALNPHPPFTFVTPPWEGYFMYGCEKVVKEKVKDNNLMGDVNEEKLKAR